VKPKKRRKGHKADVKTSVDESSLTQHTFYKNLRMDWENAKISTFIHALLLNRST